MNRAARPDRPIRLEGLANQTAARGPRGRWINALGEGQSASAKQTAGSEWDSLSSAPDQIRPVARWAAQRSEVRAKCSSAARQDRCGEVPGNHHPCFDRATRTPRFLAYQRHWMVEC